MTGPTRVLMIEDNAGDARLIREALGPALASRLALTHVERLGDGSALLKADPFDAVLLDLSLADSHGLETIRQVRAAAPLPIVVLTGLGDELAAVDAITEGAQDYLIKGTADGPAIERSIRYAIERHRLQGRLRDAHRLEAVGQLAAGVAHQFNSLMCGILGHVSLLRDGPGSAEDIDASLTQISDAAARAARLTDMLLSVGRRRTLRADSIALDDALNAMAPMLRNMAGARVRISLRLGAVSPILFDAAQLEHVVATLTLFARDAMPEGGTLSFETRDVTRADCGGAVFARLTLRDSASAREPQWQNKHFEPFHDLRELGAAGHTGLELPSVLGVMVQAGGSLELDPDAADGTCLNLDFPTRLSPAETVPAP